MFFIIIVIGIVIVTVSHIHSNLDGSLVNSFNMINDNDNDNDHYVHHMFLIDYWGIL